MRVGPSVLSVVMLVVVAASGCASNPPPEPAPVPTPEATATADAAPAAQGDAAKSAHKPEEEGWAGEESAKNGDAKNTDAKPAASGDTAPAPVADSKAPETRTMEVIRKQVVDNRKAARKCYDDARKDLKDLKGDVVVHFVIDPDGNVKSAELNQERSTLKSPAVVDCVLGVIKGIKFPKSSRAMETSTNYPFNFTP